MKYVIWGNGKRGRIAIELIGRNHILAIVDQNIEFCEKTYLGIPIIHPGKLTEEYRRNPIIITPRGYEEEIENWLCERRIYHFFRFDEEYTALLGFMKQAPKDILLSRLIGNQVLIYGWKILTLLVYQWMIECGKEGIVLLPDTVDDQLKEYIRYDLKIKIESIDEILNKKNNIVILTEEMNDMLEKKLRNQEGRIIQKYYDLTIQNDLYKNLLLRKFHNVHKNERCFIVATGPSLTYEDLAKLKQHHEICISMNGIFKGFHCTDWRPDYYMIADMAGIIEWIDEIMEMDVTYKFVADTAWVEEKMGMDPAFYKWHLSMKEWDEGEEPDFSSDFSEGTYCGYTITYHGALQLAVYMGFSEIYLLGVDCCQYESQEKQHFMPDYDKYISKGAKLDVDKNITAYRVARKYAESHGIKIYNATRGGTLEVFERVDFDSLFDEI